MKVVRLHAHRLQHRDQQGRLVLAVAIFVAVNIRHPVRLHSTNALLHNEVADVLLDVVRNAFQLGVKVWRARRQLLRLGRNLRRRVKTMRLQPALPRSQRQPLVIGALHRQIAPLHAHPRRQRRPRRSGTKPRQVQPRHIRNLPPQLVRPCLGRLHRRIAAPALRIVSACGKRQLHRLMHNRHIVLDRPVLLVHIRLQ